MIVLTEQTREKQLLAGLVRAAQDGDRQAFGQLVERYSRAVYAIALRRLRNHAEAQELVQEVFVQALRKIGQLREPECFGGWLRSITNRMAINRAVRSGPAVSVDRETLEATCVERRTPLASALRARAGRSGPGRFASAALAGPQDPGGVLRQGSVAGGDERCVPVAGRHDQAPAARGPQAAGARAGRAGPGVKRCTKVPATRVEVQPEAGARIGPASGILCA